MGGVIYSAEIYQIQSYIFQTKKLRQIIGASEWIEYICGSFFPDLIGSSFDPHNVILAAAGKFLYVFPEQDRAACQNVVEQAPFEIDQLAPGVQFVQAVVSFAGELSPEDLNLVERRLDIAKAKRPLAIDLYPMIVKRAPRTGLAEINLDKVHGLPKGVLNKLKSEEKPIDRVQLSKEIAANDKRKLFEKFVGTETFKPGVFALDFEELLSKPEEWLAIVHADGNNMGRLIQKAKSEVAKTAPTQVKNFLHEFSQQVEKSTVSAVRKAFNQTVVPVYRDEESTTPEGKTIKLPFRPVILGGDDITVIIRGKLALGFTMKYLKYFEEETQTHLGPLAKAYGLSQFTEGMTACAGISFIKYNYPFKYAVDLAEALCRHAKTVGKKANADRTPSSLMFHRVQASFVEDYDIIIEKELTVEHDAEKIRFDAGPYFLSPPEGYPGVEILEKQLKTILLDEAPQAGIREWLKVLYENPEAAEQLMNRIQRNNSRRFTERLSLSTAFPYARQVQDDVGVKQTVRFTHLADLMSLYAVHKT